LFAYVDNYRLFDALFVYLIAQQQQYVFIHFIYIIISDIRPHLYCLSILKAEIHRQALVDAILTGSPKFFLGTDSAPHATDTKESACGCAGLFTAHSAIELYAEVFDNHDALDKLQAFATQYGAANYGLVIDDNDNNKDYATITSEKKA
jgi:dihydroorotase